MPSITFALPHWIYWAGLLFVPLIAMYVVRKQRGKKVDGELSNPIAYMLLFCGGFVGLHRFYVKNSWGLIYIPIFVLLLFANIQVRNAMNLVSKEKNEMTTATFRVERARSAIKRHTEAIQNYKIQAEQTQEKAAQNRIKRRLKRVQKKLEQAQGKLETSQKTMETAKQALVVEKAGFSKWNWITRSIAMVIALMLIGDAFLLPKLVRQCAASEAREVKPAPIAVAEESPAERKYSDPALNIHLPQLAFIDKINGYTGEFICYWSIIAVFVYYYEVLARYVFNSPTNWAHESMFLMFGMQYMLAAGFALREDSHVRVDVIYLYLPDRVKAIIDLITSIFFFIFAIALIGTSWIFAADAVRVWEVSFTEWAIQYWPVKITMILGSVMLFMQGFARLVKEVVIITGKQV